MRRLGLDAHGCGMTMTMLACDDVSGLRTLEDALTGALTLAEGLAPDELDRARLTRHEVRRQLLGAVSAVASLSPAARAAMPELDCDAWRTIGERLGTGGALERGGLWSALDALAPTTLGWLRFYRAREPELFEASGGALEAAPRDGPRHGP